MKTNGNDMSLTKMTSADAIASGHDFDCTCCGRDLNPKTMVWLELSNAGRGYFRNKGELPESESQGWFTFGPACAKKALANKA
jgi:hypothetical protein